MLYHAFIHMARVVHVREPNVRIVSVPGISFVNAAASRLGVALADGDEVVAIVPATRDRGRMREVLAAHDCVIFLKVAKVLDEMLDLLTELNLLDKAQW